MNSVFFRSISFCRSTSTFARSFWSAAIFDFYCWYNSLFSATLLLRSMSAESAILMFCETVCIISSLCSYILVSKIFRWEFVNSKSHSLHVKYIWISSWLSLRSSEHLSQQVFAQTLQWCGRNIIVNFFSHSSQTSELWYLSLPITWNCKGSWSNASACRMSLIFAVIG